jgi:hypothetical protein
VSNIKKITKILFSNEDSVLIAGSEDGALQHGMLKFHVEEKHQTKGTADPICAAICERRDVRWEKS